MPETAPWIFVGFINQPLNGVFAVSYNGSGCTQSGTDKFIVNHQYPEVKTGDKLFNNHTAAVNFCRFKCFKCLFPGGNVSGVAFPMVTINGFYHQWVFKF